jgi:deoxyadenosine/deoxycytidine kinase/7,8-dihydro-6-hydroxymethylpterin-pyrophosphokinase
VGVKNGRWFLNAVMLVRTNIAPADLLSRLEEIENTFGRKGKGEKTNRTLDLDIILFGDFSISDSRLTVPHKEMCDRKFVLAPLAEIAPDAVHPVTGEPISKLLKSVQSQKAVMVEPFNNSVDYRHIVVEGPIGVGKTSLVEKLAAYFGAGVVLELATENPFLEGFYQDPAKFALPAQLFFLASRLRHLQDAEKGGLKKIVADYAPDKDLLFARLNLSGEELKLYNEIRSSTAYKPPTPDLVIFLSADDDKLLGRIKNRGRACEKGIAEKYVGSVNHAYKDWSANYEGSPSLVVETNETDFGGDPEAFGKLLWRISRPIKGRAVFNPAE